MALPPPTGPVALQPELSTRRLPNARFSTTKRPPRRAEASRLKALIDEWRGGRVPPAVNPKQHNENGQIVREQAKRLQRPQPGGPSSRAVGRKGRGGRAGGRCSHRSYGSRPVGWPTSSRASVPAAGESTPPRQPGQSPYKPAPALVSRATSRNIEDSSSRIRRMTSSATSGYSSRMHGSHMPWLNAASECSSI
jgi:hypothetical protein